MTQDVSDFDEYLLSTSDETALPFYKRRVLVHRMDKNFYVHWSMTGGSDEALVHLAALLSGEQVVFDGELYVPLSWVETQVHVPHIRLALDNALLRNTSRRADLEGLYDKS